MDQRAFSSRLSQPARADARQPRAAAGARGAVAATGRRARRSCASMSGTSSTGQVGFALFDCPPAIVRGRGALVWDADGKEYVDMLAGFSVSNTGHCHPAVTAAVAEQAGQLMHYFDLPGDQRERLAARLAALAPGVRPRRVVFGTTGADAAELAIRLARWYTGAPIILSAYGGYHGTTGATMATTAKGGMWALLLPGAARRHRPRQDPVLLPVPLPGRRRRRSSAPRPAWTSPGGCCWARSRRSPSTARGVQRGRRPARADAGQRGLHHPGRRLPARHPGAVRRVRLPADRRRDPGRAWAAPAGCGPASTSRSCRT